VLVLEKYRKNGLLPGHDARFVPAASGLKHEGICMKILLNEHCADQAFQIVPIKKTFGKLPEGLF